MGLFSIFSVKETDEFAKSLAESVVKRYPPALETSEQKKISVNRVTKILEDTFQKAVAYNADRKLGVYKKARLGNTFRWELKDRGYSEKFVEVATEGLIVYLSRKPSTEAGTPSPDR